MRGIETLRRGNTPRREDETKRNGTKMREKEKAPEEIHPGMGQRPRGTEIRKQNACPMTKNDKTLQPREIEPNQSDNVAQVPRTIHQ